MQRLVQMIHLIGVTITPLLAALIDVNEADCFPIVAISTWGCWIHIGFASGFATASDGCVFPVSFLWRVAMQLDLNRTCGVIAQLRPSDTTVMRSLIQMNGNISFLVKLWSTVLPGASGHRSVKSAFIPFSIFFFHCHHFRRLIGLSRQFLLPLFTGKFFQFVVAIKLESNTHLFDCRWSATDMKRTQNDALGSWFNSKSGTELSFLFPRFSYEPCKAMNLLHRFSFRTSAPLFRRRKKRNRNRRACFAFVAFLFIYFFFLPRQCFELNDNKCDWFRVVAGIDYRFKNQLRNLIGIYLPVPP